MRKQFKNQSETAVIIINDLACFAVIKALKKFPDANAHFLGDSIRYFKKIHLGLAIDTNRGLMVPVVKNAYDLIIIELSHRLKKIADA